MTTDNRTLRGDNIALREWTEADLPQMIVVFDDPEIAYRTPIASPFDEAAAKGYLTGIRQARQAGTRLHLAITVDGLLPQGEVTLNLSTASIAYVVGAPYRGQGLGRRALTRLVKHAYDVLGLQRTYLEIEADNVGSMSVALAAGFRPTDEEPEFVKDKGRSYAIHRWTHQRTV
ncbi:GNAT family N-acetyltransferase [Jidongwangia harbinensis]|uniref:GNAT family N-acetyltransferase n=1 Tax=Jidongwangia harbinensis TaxID=2878561 RepID=UPI001CD9FC2A|nr:GNAT family N-acetyltransferase [Jidongwangia harbinensis]MCA2217667.1 GNAT family N-acetyltransferase [Jidongwangia harbinensis]